MKIDYTKLTFTELIDKIESNRFFDIPRMVKEALKRLYENVFNPSEHDLDEFLNESDNAFVRNSSLYYSTDETLTGGIWIDGKPIYRKVIIWDLSSASMGIPYGVSDLENVVKLESIYKDEFGENFTQLPINRTELSTSALYQSELSLMLNIPDQEIYLRNIMIFRPFSTGVTTSQKYTEGGFLDITLEYTKTTN